MAFNKRNSKKVRKPEDGEQFAENIQCTLIGDRKCGKTSLLLSYQTDTFSSEYIATSFDNYTKEATYKDHLINLSLVDIGGFDIEENDAKQKLNQQEHHGFINKLIGTDVILLCFSIDDKHSFENISRKWIHQILSYYISSSEDIVDGSNSQEPKVISDLTLPIMLLVGCKNDRKTQQPLLEQIEAQRQSITKTSEDGEKKIIHPTKIRSIVSSKEAMKASRAMRAYSYMECSARWGTGVKEIFNVAIKAVLERRAYNSIQRFEAINSLQPSSDQDDDSEIQRIISYTKTKNYSVLRNKREYYDKVILNVLKDDPSAVNKIDHDYFHAAFRNGLNQTVLHILDHYPDRAEALFVIRELSRNKKPSHPLVTTSEFRASERVVLKLLDVCQNQIEENLKDRNYRQETILHILVRRGYENATKKLVEKFTKIYELYFECDGNEMTPFMSALSKDSIKNEDLLIQLWNNMKRHNKACLTNVINSKDNRHNNLFHLCAMFSKYNVFKEIVELIWQNSGAIRLKTVRTLFEPNKGSGDLPFHLFRDNEGEEIIFETLTKLQNIESEIDIDLSKAFIVIRNKKGNSSLSIFAKKNFETVIDWIMNYTSGADLKKLLLEVNKEMNNPPMVCVIHNRNEILKRFLMFLFSTKYMTTEEVKKFLHQRNIFNETILSLVMQHESTMLLPQMLLLEKEKEIHQNIGKNGDGGLKKQAMESLSSCLRNNDLRSAEVAKTIARVENSYEKTTCWEKFKIFLLVLATTFLIPLAIQVSDLSFDGLVVHSYWIKVQKGSNGTDNDKNDEIISERCNATNSLADIPAALDALPILGYSLSFMLFPWIFYIIEFFTSRYMKETERESSIVFKHNMKGISQDNFVATFKELVVRQLRIVLILLKTILLIICWPFAMTIKRFHSELRFAMAYGKEKFEMQMKRRDDTILYSRARMIEVCIESSFQPLLQLYLVLPTLIHYVRCETYRNLLEEPLAKTFNTRSGLQFLSVTTSVLGLTWSFNFYKTTQKYGALAWTANPVGRICLSLSTFLQITSRLLTFVLLAYCFGPGNFWPMIVLVNFHIILMGILHFITSRESERNYTLGNWKRTLHHCLLNGIGNIYIHNYIIYMDEKKMKEKMKRRTVNDGPKIKRTFYRQVIFNGIFILENTVVVAYALSNTYLNDQIPGVLLGLIPFGQLMGLLFHVIYYQFFHLWKELLHMHIDF